MISTDSSQGNHSTRIRIWAKSVFYNVGLQLVLRIVTFVANAFIVRLLSKDILGLVNVRILLFYTSVQFLSREAFRRTCFSSFKQDITELQVSFVNLSYFCLPIGALFGSILWYVWARVLELPQTNLVVEYENTLLLVLFSVLIELSVEVFYIYGQRNDYIKLKVIIEGIFQFFRVICFTMVAIYYPQNAILGFGFSQITASLTYAACYVLYFVVAQKKPLSMFVPDLTKESLRKTTRLFGTSLQFLLNTIVKQILTEGERYVMTIFTIISLAEQGIYDIINNLASLPARLIFQQIEENSYRLFSSIIKRDLDYKQQKESTERSAAILVLLCRFMLMLGLLIFVYGYNYSELALYLYGGNVLIGDNLAWLSVALMRWQCLYIILIALNGIIESFTFASMNNRMMQTFSMSMIILSLSFLAISLYTVRLFGCQGFILGNCFNMLMRIVYGLHLVTKICDKTYRFILEQIVPSRLVLVSFIVIFSVLNLLNNYLLSQRLLEANMLSKIVSYLFVGGLLFLFHILFIYSCEKKLFHSVQDNYFSSKKQK